MKNLWNKVWPWLRWLFLVPIALAAYKLLKRPSLPTQGQGKLTSDLEELRRSEQAGRDEINAKTQAEIARIELEHKKAANDINKKWPIAFLLFVFVLTSCVTIPKPIPLKLEPYQIENTQRPSDNLKSLCSDLPTGVTVCPTIPFKSNMHLANDTNKELRTLVKKHNDHVDKAALHDRMDLKRHKRLEEEMTTMKWKSTFRILGVAVLSFLIGGLAL